MLAGYINDLKFWLKNHPNKFYRNVFLILKKTRSLEIPTPQVVNISFYFLYKFISNLINTTARIALYTPAFKGRLSHYGKHLFLYGGLPYVSGPLRITVGDNCRISGQTTLSGRTHSTPPSLSIGSNVDIGWQTTIAVGQKVIIEDNVRIAGRAFLFGYSGHPLDANRRALGEPDDEWQVGNIVLRRDVWLCTNVSVKHGVTIGEGTIVAAGSVVTGDLPPFVIAAGNPAKVIRSIEKPYSEEKHYA
ncbi:acyltransferase [Vibrio marisflavi]|uniref:2,3,4,5-tetrahydropyridine-2,6-dicarboxylate N-acetyltransferase n=1 Tax=Vibrio marisflavi CECT 7928 TaxID=634439 RepID=A0ABM8ZZ71_9VIBR|nr:acyltransferase [Vibrio marisflavi]CAH0536147.1 2,3,4,5-tetrahydropyridine-2,6-dicarboxylate N-acetyltransferase [Vibrio marisflavi CECT 7928]